MGDIFVKNNSQNKHGKTVKQKKSKHSNITNRHELEEYVKLKKKQHDLHEETSCDRKTKQQKRALQIQEQKFIQQQQQEQIKYQQEKRKLLLEEKRKLEIEELQKNDSNDDMNSANSLSSEEETEEDNLLKKS